MSEENDFDWPAGKNEARERLGEKFDDLHLDTKLSTTHAKVLKNADPIVTPIYHASVYRVKEMAEYFSENHGNNHIYRRCGNPTTENLEVMIAELEGGAATLSYNSGLAALTGVLLEFLGADTHIICMSPLYSGTYSFITETLGRYGVKVSFVDVETEKNFPEAVEKQITEKTKMIFVETIANPTMAVPDLQGTFAVAQKHKVLSFVDATFSSPYLVQPIKLGADIVMHSCSKYIGGHSDAIGGCVTTREMSLWRRLKIQQLTTGSSLSPFDASLFVRGLKTLALRIEKISANALAVAEFLESHPKTTNVNYPGLPSHPGHKFAAQVMTQFSGMIGFDVGSAENAIKFVESLKLITHAVSLGGTESLIEHPMSVSHGKQLMRGETKVRPVSPGLLRFSVGVENVKDLIADLDQALAKL